MRQKNIDEKVDQRRFDLLIGRKVLLHTRQAPELNLESGQKVLLALCGDGDCFNGKYAHFCNIYKTELTHVLATNGGALYLHPNAAMLKRRPNKRAELIMDILEGSALKNTSVVASFVHWKCGVGLVAGMNLFDVINASVKGSAFLESFDLSLPENQNFSDFVDMLESETKNVAENELRLLGGEIEGVQGKRPVMPFRVRNFLHIIINGEQKTFAIDNEVWLKQDIEELNSLATQEIQVEAQYA